MKKFGAVALAIATLCGAYAAKADTCNGVSTNLVSNCGFESGSFSGWTGSTTSDFNSGVDGLVPYQGAYEAFLGAIGTTATLSQTLATTAGTTYNIEFALMNDTSYVSPYLNSFAVAFGGTTLFSETNVAASAYKLYTLTGVATGSSTVLSFMDRNDAGYFDLDSVSVAGPSTAVTPEPSSLVLLGSGLLGSLGVMRRRWQR